MAGLRSSTSTGTEKLILAVLLIGGLAAVSAINITCLNDSKFLIQIFDVTNNMVFTQLSPGSYLETGSYPMLANGTGTSLMFFSYVAPNTTTVENFNRVVFAKASVYPNAAITFFQPQATTVPLVGISVAY